MPRKPREELAGAIQHAYARGNAKMDIFRDNRDMEAFLRLLERVIGQTKWRCLGYCLLHNHFHLLVETPEPNLGQGMQRLTGDFARYFNDRHERSGHVFQGRYGATRVTTDEQLWWVVRYIANNPVEAGLCRAADAWPWSSHGAMATGEPPPWLDPGRLLELGARRDFATKGV